MKISRTLLLLLALTGFTRAADEIKVGFLSLDTSHATAFAGMFNDPKHKTHVPGARVVVGYPGGSPDIESSWSRVKGYTEELRTKYGVEIVNTPAEVVAKSDAIIILSVDGRAHLPLAKEAFGKGKPVFIDKPLGGNLREVLAIVKLAEETKTPLFSTSSLRYSPGVLKLRTAKIGRMLGAISYGPAATEPHHTDLYWYGIHPTEALYTVMGVGCQTVSRVYTADTDVVTGVWNDGRTGVMYGMRGGKGTYRVTVMGTTAVVDQEDGHDYAPMLVDVVKFFRTGVSPVPIAETVELMAFMEAADESKKQNGALVSIKDVIAKNR